MVTGLIRTCSVGIDQPEFYRKVIAVLSKAKPPEDWIKEAIELIINHELSYDALYTHLMDVLLEFLDTAPLKERAIHHSEELRDKDLMISVTRIPFYLSLCDSASFLVEGGWSFVRCNIVGAFRPLT